MKKAMIIVGFLAISTNSIVKVADGTSRVCTTEIYSPTDKQDFKNVIFLHILL